MNKFTLLLILFLLSACQTQTSKELELKKSEFQIDDVVKADIDMFADVLIQQSMDYLQLLARKLYLRNPNQLRRAHINNIDQAVARLFVTKWPEALPELGDKRSVASIQLAFDETFEGDRVAALVDGLRGMLLDAYGGKTKFHLYDSFYPQKIYNLARNFEVAFWKLGHDRDLNGKLFLLSNSTDTSLILNLSFERLYGKLIALHDQMAIVIANTTNRYIKNVIQSVATMVFLPI
ncbi:MAG: hypothetical protein QM504_18620 [Pseudomonadota bacterium]